jgi:diadenosine tetraphosphate (Ap4A) HIT family hydrolase
MRESSPNECLFCTLPAERIIARNAHALAIADAFPVSPGHTLIIPHRHISSFFHLTGEELLALYDLLHHAKGHLDSTLEPKGYNIGVNDGQAAGQTVMHLHIHLIPRFVGDVADPRGGVRHLIPGKGLYPGAED